MFDSIQKQNGKKRNTTETNDWKNMTTKNNNQNKNFAYKYLFEITNRIKF